MNQKITADLYGYTGRKKGQNHMLTSEVIYKTIYSYLENQPEVENLDAHLKTWTRTKPSSSPGSIGELINLCANLKEDIRQKANKAAGKGNIEKGMQAVIKSAAKNHRSNMAGYFLSNGLPTVCDGYRLMRSKVPFDIGEPVQGLDAQKLLDGTTREAGTELEFPSLGELKSYIKIQKLENSSRGKSYRVKKILYDFGEDKPMLDAVYMLDMLTAFPDAKAYYEPEKINAAVYFNSETGEGILLPIRR